MIQVKIYRDAHNQISSFNIEGHAYFDESGKDIVCAAVSAVSFGAINAIETLLDISLDISTNQRDGRLSCVIPESIERERVPKVQLLLEGMVVTLRSIEQEYHEFIHITDRIRR